MAEWYDKSPDDRTDDELRAAWECYYETLLGTAKGRQVLCDMERRVAEQIKGCAHNPALAVAQIWLEAFVKDSLTIAGAGEPIKRLEAMAKVARSHIPPARPKPKLPQGYIE
jgi:hypothetical protein